MLVKMRSARSVSDAAPGCSATQSMARTQVPIFIPWLKRLKPTVSIPTATSRGCSSICLWRRRQMTTMRCCLGACPPISADPYQFPIPHAFDRLTLKGVVDGPHTIEHPKNAGAPEFRRTHKSLR
ncbi:hypothetical protein PT2222_460022 [Paraburkholderia tropica]